MNNDGEVNIADVNCLTDVIVGGNNTYEGRADVNADGEVTIADINSVINIILGDATPTTPTHDPEYVDLGLPSGTLWATCNIGANNPEEYGDFFAWGETVPKDYYGSITYKWCNGEYNMTKYCTESPDGTLEVKTELDSEDDAAYVNWGPQWRTPTMEQINELIETCTWTTTTLNGVNGRLVTGPNGNSIFLPAPGSYYSERPSEMGEFGIYWSRTLKSNYMAYGLIFDPYYSSAKARCSSSNRQCGHTVRAVRLP